MSGAAHGRDVSSDVPAVDAPLDELRELSTTHLDRPFEEQLCGFWIRRGVFDHRAGHPLDVRTREQPCEPEPKLDDMLEKFVGAVEVEVGWDVELVDIGVNDRREEFRLSAKMLVETRFGNLGVAREHFRRNSFHPVLGEQRASGMDQSLPRGALLRARHALHYLRRLRIPRRGMHGPGSEISRRRNPALNIVAIRLPALRERLQAGRASWPQSAASLAGGSLREMMDAFERQVLLLALERTGWNVRQTAKASGPSRAALYTRMSKCALTREKYSGKLTSPH